MSSLVTSMASSMKRDALGREGAAGSPGDGDATGRHPRVELLHDDARVVGVDREVRHDRAAEAGSDHRLDRTVVDRPEHVDRLDPQRVEPAVDEPLAQVLRGHAHQRRAVEGAGRDRCAGGGVLGAGEDDVAVVDQLDGLEPRVVVVLLDHEAEVELTGDEALDQLVVVVGLEQPHLEARLLGLHPADDRGEQLVGDALERADDEPAGLAAAQPFEVVGRGRDLRQHRAGVLEQQLAGRA